jgi:rhodanese-related sulfurtransferase
VSDEPSIETELEPRRAAELIGDGAQLIDVRRSVEWDGGRLAGARHIEINELTEAASTIARDQPVVFYCRSGDRSQMAAQAFREAGYDAYNLAGGITAWAAGGMAVEPEGGEIVQPPPPS